MIRGVLFSFLVVSFQFVFLKPSFGLVCTDLFAVSIPYRIVDVSQFERRKNLPQYGEQGVVTSAEPVKNSLKPTYIIVGSLEYSIVNNKITLNRLNIPSAFENQGVYESLLKGILSRNPQANQIFLTIDERYIQSSEIALLEAQQIAEVVESNPFFVLMGRLGWNVTKFRFSRLEFIEGRTHLSLTLDRNPVEASL